MNNDSIWLIQFHQEIQHAERARLEGNEGMARVCARRAAGLAAGEYLNRKGITPSGTSAYHHLRDLSNLSEASLDVQETASHFLVKVSTDHTLPIEADLIADARWMMQLLFDPDE